MGQEIMPRTDQADAVELLYVRPSRTADTPVFTRHNAMRSRHWRFWLGLFEVFSGLLTCWVTVTSAATGIGHLRDMATSGVEPPAAWIAYVFAVTLAFGVVSIAGLAIGIWNLATLRRTARSPLIAVSAASIVLMMVFFDGSLLDPVKIVWVALHAIVSLWTVGMLRLKKVTAP
jgi:hypothetical protein